MPNTPPVWHTSGMPGGTLPKEIFPSSYQCDCGHQSHFVSRTIREIKAMSQKRLIYLGDSEVEEHTIVFYRNLVQSQARLWGM